MEKLVSNDARRIHSKLSSIVPHEETDRFAVMSPLCIWSDTIIFAFAKLLPFIAAKYLKGKIQGLNLGL
jgi:hypothetical protein